MSSRRCIPPDSSSTAAPVRSSSCANSISSSARLSASRRGTEWYPPKLIRFSRAVRSPSRVMPCGTTPSRALIARRSSRTLRPSTYSWPAVGGETQVIILIVVVLPAPFGPRKPKQPPTGISRSIPSTATVVAKCFTRPRASTASMRPMLEAPQQREELGRRVDDDVRGLYQLARRLVRRDRDPDTELEPVERAEGVEVGRVVARVERPVQPRFPEQLHDRCSLVRMHGRTDLEHFAPEARRKAGLV